jgi:septal ring factor EnvC (AmiA/AmiB activator)
MQWSRNVLASGASALGVALLLSGTVSRAEDAKLETNVDDRAAANDKAAAVQKEVDKLSDDTGDMLEQYRTALKQIDAITVYNSQMRSLIASQEAEMNSLGNQVDRVEIVGRSVTPLMLRMIAALEQFVKLDVPFLLDERTKRVEELNQTMSRADVSTAEKFRQIMEAYQIENEFGRTIEAYRGTLQVEGKEITVDFLRFGRIALVYQSLDESMAGTWNKQEKKWESLDSSYRSAIRQGMRIARKQAAPDLIRLPLAAATRGEG